MASKQAVSRLRKELKAISADPPPHIHVSCDEANILSWNYLLEGPSDTPYEGGWYWGRLKFPKNYPFAPPSILMVTPSGRFETNTRLCLSMSDYHPESWQPAWSLATVLKGLLSFMCEESPTAGAVEPPASDEERRRLAKASLEWNKAQAEFIKVFPEVDEFVAAAASRKEEEAKASTASAEEQQQPASEARPETDDRPPAAVAAAAEEQRRREEEEDASRPPAVGDVVRLCGLKARADLNGQEGVLETPSQMLATAGRVQVRAGAEVVGVKPENVELVSRGAPSSKEPEPASAEEKDSAR